MTHAGSLDRLRQDFRYGVRLLRLNPGFAATAILSLALGIAANTSIFTLTDQILLRLLPVQNPRELVQFRMEGGRIGSQNGDGLHTFSYPMYIAFRDRNTVFSGLTGQVHRPFESPRRRPWRDGRDRLGGRQFLPGPRSEAVHRTRAHGRGR